MRICVLVLLLLAAALPAAGVECANASLPMEKAICASNRLSAADAAMGAAYRADLAQLTSTGIGLLRADQVQWLAWAQQVCLVSERLMTAAETAQCLQPLYNERVKALRKAVIRLDGLSFLTRTQYLAAPDPVKSAGVEPHPGFGTVQATWPVADAGGEDWDAWNRAVELRLLRMAGPAESATPPAAAWTDSLAEELDAIANVHLKSIEHDRVTVGLSAETMVHGGAHPYETWETMTYLLNEHRALRADDVFAPDAASGWKQALAQACWTQMSTGERKNYIYPQIKGPEAKEIQQVILDVSRWTLEKDGLHISYPEYAVTPRYALMNDAVIGWGDLKPFLSPHFVLP